MNYVLGIDIGTTGTKALLVNEKGEIVARGYKGYGLVTPGDGRIEQDARLWWDAVAFSVRQACAGIDSRNVRALSLSTQGASSLLVDADGTPLMNAITWMDSRASLEADELANRIGHASFYRRTGWPVSPALDAAKLLWLERHERETFKKADKFLSTMEYINLKLVGNAVIDPTNAAMRQLMNLETIDWDAEILSALEIDRGFLPSIVLSGEYIGELKSAAAKDLGLSSGVRVYNGAHDQYCACLGSGISETGEFMLSTGTSWVLMTVTEKPIFTDSYISPGPHVERGLWGALASIGPSGAALDWFKRNFLAENYEEIESRCDTILSVKQNVFFLPYLGGRGFPQENPQSRAAFLGLGFEHDRYAAAMAIMEGVVFQMRMALDEYRLSGCDIHSLRVTGGALNSGFWTNLIGYNADCEVFQMSESDTSCIGSAAFAGVGSGFFSDYRTAISLMNKPRPVVSDDASFRSLYAEKFDRYKKIATTVSLLTE